MFTGSHFPVSFCFLPSSSTFYLFPFPFFVSFSGPLWNISFNVVYVSPSYPYFSTHWLIHIFHLHSFLNKQKEMEVVVFKIFFPYSLMHVFL